MGNLDGCLGTRGVSVADMLDATRAARAFVIDTPVSAHNSAASLRGWVFCDLKIELKRAEDGWSRSEHARCLRSALLVARCSEGAPPPGYGAGSKFGFKFPHQLVFTRVQD